MPVASGLRSSQLDKLVAGLSGRYLGIARGPRRMKNCDVHGLGLDELELPFRLSVSEAMD